MWNRAAFAAIASACVTAIPTAALAQVGSAELLVRIDRLENQIRQLTGEIEQMQYRNQQLEAALKRLQDDNAYRPQEPGSRGGLPAAPVRPGAVPPNQPGALGGRRSDAFDPAENPNAPGAPRVLGAIPPHPAPAVSPQKGIGIEPTPYGVGAGAPANVDPGSGRFPAGAAQPPPGSTPPYPPPLAGEGRVGVATAPPSSSPRDAFDLGMGYLQHRDYALAEETFREFLNRYPSDRLAADAQFGLGESLFQRQNYQEAANAFVTLSKKYETSAKAPDALLRLGQSLAAMNERELACVAFGDVGHKYPRASPSVKQAIEREQKRARC